MIQFMTDIASFQLASLYTPWNAGCIMYKCSRHIYKDYDAKIPKKVDLSDLVKNGLGLCLVKVLTD